MTGFRLKYTLKYHSLSKYCKRRTLWVFIMVRLSKPCLSFKMSYWKHLSLPRQFWFNHAGAATQKLCLQSTSVGAFSKVKPKPNKNKTDSDLSRSSVSLELQTAVAKSILNHTLCHKGKLHWENLPFLQDGKCLVETSWILKESFYICPNTQTGIRLHSEQRYWQVLRRKINTCLTFPHLLEETLFHS